MTVLIISCSLFCFSQDAANSEKINNAIKKGNAKELAQFFNSSIELVVIKNENVYSKSQAELILADFFKKYKPVGFSVQHNGQSKNSKYAIGTLNTKLGSFRVYYLTKPKKNSHSLIYLLRIEKKDKF